MTVATTTKKYRFDWLTIVYMTSIHLIALLAFVPANFSWGAIGIALFLHWVTAGLGITLGFHRLATHRSFETPKWLEYFFVFCGTLACQSGPIQWVGWHRIHHKYSDTPEDPHDSNEGFWWSHLGWMIHHIPADQESVNYAKDIASDPVYRFLSNFFVPIQVLLGLLLFWMGGWSYVIWGIFVRLVLVFHCTWLVNSATHQFGYQSHESGDRSTNCWWVALVTYGEGWHNNHHAFQYSARHGLQWWEIDLTWLTIRFLKRLGLAKKIKIAPVPTSDII